MANFKRKCKYYVGVRITGADAETEEESPLRRWMNERFNSE